MELSRQRPGKNGLSGSMCEGKRLGNHVVLKLNQGIWVVYLFKNEEKAKKERRMAGRQVGRMKEGGREGGGEGIEGKHSCKANKTLTSRTQ